MKLCYLAPLSLALLVGCSEQPAATQKKAEAKPAEAVGAQYAFYQMFIQARTWAPDATPLRMGNLDLKAPKSQGGKAAAWECTFVSERSHMMRRFTYSVVEDTDLPQGTFGGSQDPWSSRGAASPFPIQAFKVDSVKAYDVATTKAAAYAKKHPDVPVKFILEDTKRFSNPTWRVFWGESVATSSYSVFVDATTGDYLQTVR